MGLRKGHSYSRIKRPYTRKSKVKSKSYISTIPQNKIIRYEMGDKKRKYEYMLSLVSNQNIQIRHNALESCRQIVNRRLNLRFGSDYLFVLCVYPHHILRENKMIVGAGADRMQKGMQKSFGRPIGLAAQMKKGQAVFFVLVNKEKVDFAKIALKLAVPRMPGRFTIDIKKLDT